MPKTLGSVPNHRTKSVIVVIHPYCPPNPVGPQYEQYCCQSLIKHKLFRQIKDLLAGRDTYAEAYSIYLQSDNVPSSLADDIYILQQNR